MTATIDQHYQSIQRQKWFAQCGQDFSTRWLPVPDICHLVFEYLILWPHQFDASKSDPAKVTVAKDGLSVRIKEDHAAIMTRWPLCQTSSTIRFRLAHLERYKPWLGLCKSNFALSSVSSIGVLPGQWITGQGIFFNGCDGMRMLGGITFRINDVITIKCNLETGHVYLYQNDSQSSLIFQNIPDLSNLHFYIEGQDVNVEILAD